jgi:hypothetical protein
VGGVFGKCAAAYDGKRQRADECQQSAEHARALANVEAVERGGHDTR